MAQHRGRDGEWPRQRTEDGAGRGDPVLKSLTPDGVMRSDRSLAGPLRLGTAPGVGPRRMGGPTGTDFGVDRVSPRGFDPMGTSDSRAPAQEASTTIRKS